MFNTLVNITHIPYILLLAIYLNTFCGKPIKTEVCLIINIIGTELLHILEHPKKSQYRVCKNIEHKCHHNSIKV